MAWYYGLHKNKKPRAIRYARSRHFLKMNIPGLDELPGRLLSQCGLVTMVLMVAIIWLAVQLAKTRAEWESERAGMLKLYTSQNEAFDRLATSHAKLEGMLMGVQNRSG